MRVWRHLWDEKRDKTFDCESEMSLIDAGCLESLSIRRIVKWGCGYPKNDNHT